MDDNQIVATLQIEDSEIRVVVGQFYRGLFSIVAKSTVECRKTGTLQLSEEANYLEAIRAVCNDITSKLAVALDSVILVVPAYRFKRERRTIEHLLYNHVVSYKDINEIINAAYKTSVGPDYEIVNVSCGNYRINGITYPKIPLKEKGDILYCDVDIICGDKMLIYDYASLVEKAGLKIIDIVQDGFGACKEASLLEQSYDHYIINVHLEGNHTVYSLLYKGRLVAGFSDNQGYDNLVRPIMDEYGLTYKYASRLLFRYATIGKEDGENRLINSWKEDGVEKSITYNQLQKTIYKATVEFADMLYQFCSNILADEAVTVVVTGHGGSLRGLSQTLEAKFNRKVTAYVPDTLGVRECKWSALLGTFYILKEMQKIRKTVVNSVDLELYKQNLFPVIEDKETGNHLTNKIKSIKDRFVEDNND